MKAIAAATIVIDNNPFLDVASLSVVIGRKRSFDRFAENVRSDVPCTAGPREPMSTQKRTINRIPGQDGVEAFTEEASARGHANLRRRPLILIANVFAILFTGLPWDGSV